MKSSCKVRIDNTFKILITHMHQKTIFYDPRIIYQYIRRPEFFFCFSEHFLNIRL